MEGVGTQWGNSAVVQLGDEDASIHFLRTFLWKCSPWTSIIHITQKLLMQISRPHPTHLPTFIKFLIPYISSCSQKITLTSYFTRRGKQSNLSCKNSSIFHIYKIISFQPFHTKELFLLLIVASPSYLCLLFMCAQISTNTLKIIIPTSTSSHHSDPKLNKLLEKLLH